MSLPVWEEWIEMEVNLINILILQVSSRMGRVDWNAKAYRIEENGEIESLPVWEEWIEMYNYVGDNGRILSLPVWEEWIEITMQ